MASRRYRGHPLADEPQRTFDVLRESGKVWSEGFGKPPGGLSELGPTEHLLYGCRHAFSVEPLGSQENAGAGPLKGLHVQVLVHVAGEPDHRHPGRNACCVVGLPPLQSTTAERAAAASPGR